MEVHDFDSPTKGQALSVLFLSDVHSEFIDVEAFFTIKRLFQQVPIKRRRIILGGDILDMKFLVDKSEEFKRAAKLKDFDGYFVPEMQKEIEWFEWFYKEIRELVDKDENITFMAGNHEQRVERPKFRDLMPFEYEPWFNLRRQLKVEERSMRYLNYNDWLRIKTAKGGDFYFTHGVLCGANPIKKHMDLMRQASGIMFGHTHERGVRSFKNVGPTHIGFNNACLSDLSPGYMGERPNNWSIGASIMTFDHNWWYVNQFTVNNGELRDPMGRKV